jgi:hypothetical protein
MGKAKKTRKFAEVKRLLNPKDLKPCVRVESTSLLLLNAIDSSF